MGHQLTKEGAELCLSKPFSDTTGDDLNITRAPYWDTHDLCAPDELAFQIDNEDTDKNTIDSVVFLRNEHYVKITGEL